MTNSGVASLGGGGLAICVNYHPWEGLPPDIKFALSSESWQGKMTIRGGILVTRMHALVLHLYLHTCEMSWCRSRQSKSYW